LIHFVSPDIFCHRLLYAFFDDFQYSLFDFPHLSSFNACEELDYLIILYPLSPALMSIGGHCPPNYYGGAALDCAGEMYTTICVEWSDDHFGRR